QAALNLFADQRIDADSLVTVARDMVSNYGFTPEELAKSFEDLHKRGFLPEEVMNFTLSLLKQNQLLPVDFVPGFHPTKALQKIGEKILGLDLEDPWVPDHIDYLNDFR